jgi:hypothetical protein
MTEERKSVLLEYPFGLDVEAERHFGPAVEHFKQVIAAAYERELKNPSEIIGLQEPGYSYSPAPPRSDFPAKPSLFHAVHETPLL